MPLTVSCSSKSRLVYLPGFTFLVPAHAGILGQNPRGLSNGCVCVCLMIYGQNMKASFLCLSCPCSHSRVCVAYYYLRRRRRLCFRCGLFVCLSTVVCLFVSLFVCLFVCLSVGLLANLRTDFDEIFWRGRA